MVRGEQEQRCFDVVRDKLTKHQYNSAVSEKELHIIRKAFQIATPNPKASEFPDFIFENGFVEHFQVTSAKETKKGAKVKVAESAFERENEKIFEDMQKNPPIFDSPIALTTQMREMDCPVCSYGDYVTSFKKNWEHHIESFDKYNGNKEIGIFLIQQTGAPIVVKRNGTFSEFYHLQMDSDLLSYMEYYSNKIHYVIYCHQEFCDIISLIDLPKSTYKQNITFDVGQLRETRLFLLTDINPNLM